MGDPQPPSGSSFLPNQPDSSGNYGSCTTPYDGMKGYCISEDKCTGGTFNGLCNGGSSIKCCVAETRPTTAVPAGTQLTYNHFYNLFEGISDTRARALYPYFVTAMNTASINTCYRIAAFVAQLGHESVGLRYFEEIASGAAYEWRSDLGNNQPGDGRRYKGRGPIQLTGRANYRNAGQSLNRPFESKPELVCMPSGGFQAATWFWSRGNLNRYATASYNDFVTLTRRINGGTNGLQDRLNRWAKAKNYMKCGAAETDLLVASTDADTTAGTTMIDKPILIGCGVGMVVVVALVAVVVAVYRRRTKPDLTYAEPLA